jgi:hypothetical protein
MINEHCYVGLFAAHLTIGQMPCSIGDVKLREQESSYHARLVTNKDTSSK